MLCKKSASAENKVVTGWVSLSGPWVPLQSSWFALGPNALIECNYSSQEGEQPKWQQKGN